jgi:hypothetical protein
MFILIMHHQIMPDNTPTNEELQKRIADLELKYTQLAGQQAASSDKQAADAKRIAELEDENLSTKRKLEDMRGRFHNAP